MQPGCVGVPIISVVTIAALDADTNTIEVADANERLLLLHFNDVYNITEREAEPCGGVPRFGGLLHSFKEQNPLILFSGDALSPSNSTCVRASADATTAAAIGGRCTQNPPLHHS
jgi:hypothetical protein